ncbi:hypothetical protein GCM10010284_48030 [Streptomyces rubiginosohelvolus]|uniref:Uncharacterized protein n=1 Tax=Streptomyces rubiginosohelvolus TaxID=67362 RepID=A0ABQ3BYS0_9ACTN|nr:hypothetical protein GCM10010284_48030 [Streptomyces rubiginosohelvolus]GGZ61701.1 hypothetical protein GCM10010328_40430 [Streptomyces pluricolorescens]
MSGRSRTLTSYAGDVAGPAPVGQQSLDGKESGRGRGAACGADGGAGGVGARSAVHPAAGMCGRGCRIQPLHGAFRGGPDPAAEARAYRSPRLHPVGHPLLFPGAPPTGQPVRARIRLHRVGHMGVGPG